LGGVTTPDAAASPLMPGFGHVLTDRQVAELAEYLRTRFSSQPAWEDLEGQVARIRSEQQEAGRPANGIQQAQAREER
jgi:mono/diheme cytochrome c family protein